MARHSAPVVAAHVVVVVADVSANFAAGDVPLVAEDVLLVAANDLPAGDVSPVAAGDPPAVGDGLPAEKVPPGRPRGLPSNWNHLSDSRLPNKIPSAHFLSADRTWTS